MIINFEGETYEWTGRVMVSEEAIIHRHTGMHYVDWLQSIEHGDGRSIQTFLWLLKKHKGAGCEITTLDFDMVAFMEAFGNAVMEEEAAKAAKDKAPKARRTPVSEGA